MGESHREGQAIPDKLRQWLKHAVEAGASDLHLIAGYPPVLRLHGDLVELLEPCLEKEETRTILCSLCPPEALARLQALKNIDLSFEMVLDGQIQRFRTNLFHSGGQMGGCLRVVPAVIPDFAWSGFPANLAERLAFVQDGLVILTGATGSGKTTTMAILVNLLNQTGGYRIITVEEPVEYLFPQTRLGGDPAGSGRRRLDLCRRPEIRATARPRRHPRRRNSRSRNRSNGPQCRGNGPSGVRQPAHSRRQGGRHALRRPVSARCAKRNPRRLAMSLRAIVSQRLLPGTVKGEKRHLALEVLWNTYPIASAIRSGKVESIDNYLITGREEGMLSFDESVRQLLAAGKITREVAEQNVRDLSMLPP